MSEESKQEPIQSIAVQEKITPQVGSGGKFVKYMGIIFLAVLAAILGRGFFAPNQYGGSKQTEPTVRVASALDTPLNLNLNPAEVQQPANLPVVPKETPPPPPSVLPSRNVQEPFNNESNETRIKSPSQVYSAADQKASDTQRGNQGSVVGGDPNSSFLQQAANAQVVTVSAKRTTHTEYKILQGKLISAILETSIDSDMPGMVRAVVSKDVYGDTGNIVLLPRGTRLIGQYNSTLKVGQTRVAAAWTRAITPNHVDIALGSPSADPLGRGGMPGDVDSHFWQIFGTSALLSVLGAAASSGTTGTSSNGNTTYGTAYENSVTQGILNSSNALLQSRITIQPTIRIPQGSPIQVFVARDLDFSTLAYSP